MANDADQLSSPFDEMLANNREQFDALYGGEQGGLAGASGLIPTFGTLCFVRR